MKTGLLLGLLLVTSAIHAEKKPWELQWGSDSQAALKACADLSHLVPSATCSVSVSGELGIVVSTNSATQHTRQIAIDLCNGMQMRVALVVSVGGKEQAVVAFTPPSCGVAKSQVT